MDKLSIATALAALALAALASAQGQPASKQALPEIVNLLPSGRYQGMAGGDDLTIDIQDSKASGRIEGTASIRQASGPCPAVFPVAGEMKPDGAVQMESRAQVERECKRNFDLRLSGNELGGFLRDSRGVHEVKLKRVAMKPLPGADGNAR